MRNEEQAQPVAWLDTLKRMTPVMAACRRLRPEGCVQLIMLRLGPRTTSKAKRAFTASPGIGREVKITKEGLCASRTNMAFLVTL